jgi:DNA-binding GntR family transcriptional regulator
MSPELDRPLPPYLQIVEHFRDQIHSGALRDGDRLPSARQLVEQWGVAHATAAKVLATLRAEGLVKTTSGGAGGTVVDVHDVGNAPRDRMRAVRRWGRIYPADEHAQIVSAELTPNPPAYVTEALEIEPGASAIRRQRVTLKGDHPVSTSISWFAGTLAEVAPDLLVTERIKQGTPGYIEQCTGRVMAYGRDQVTAVAASADIAATLGILEGTAVIVGRNWVRDREGVVLEFGESVSVPTRPIAYEYEIK